MALSLKKTLPKCVELADLESAGVFGLVRAIENFDPGRGVKFTTYAGPRVRGAMLDWLREVDWVPRQVRSRGEEPVGMESIDRVRLETDGGRAVTGVQLVADESAPDPAGETAHRDMLKALTRGMSRREALVVELYYFADLNMKEIGGVLGCSASRVSQTHSALLPRIRSRFSRPELEELLAAG